MELIIQTLKSLSLVIVDPTLALILVVLALVFYLRNRKISIMQKMIAGESINSPLELTASQICFGLIGGILGSIILTTLGVVFSKTSGIQF
ncbi:MAG: signal protein PDZ, partial [Clostridium sp.]